MTKAAEHFVDWICKKVWPIIDPQEQLFSIQLDITNECNLACPHCYLPDHKNDGALGFDQWLLVLNQFDVMLKKLRMKPRITLCGGEPLLSPFLIPLLKEIRQRFGDIDLSVQTNGTTVTQEIAREFKALSVIVQVSINGPDAKRNNLIMGQGVFERIMEGCRQLKEHGVPFTHQAILSRRTAPWIADFFGLPPKTGATAMHFTRLIPEGSARHLTEGEKDAPLSGLELKKHCKISSKVLEGLV